MIWRAETSAEKKQALAIREQVFVQEQHVPLELEHDEHDATALHFLAGAPDQPLGTARLLLDRPAPGWAKVGRVAVLAPARGGGWGRRLMEALQQTAAELGCKRFVLDAQTDALPFYERLGYQAEGEVFLDAGIPHRRMTLCLP